MEKLKSPGRRRILSAWQLQQPYIVVITEPLTPSPENTESTTGSETCVIQKLTDERVPDDQFCEWSDVI